MKQNFKKSIVEERPLGYLIMLDKEYLKIEFRVLIREEGIITGVIRLETTLKRPKELDLIWGNFIEVYDFIDEIKEENLQVTMFKDF